MRQVLKVIPVLDCPEMDWRGLIGGFFLFRDRGSDGKQGAENATSLEKHGILYFLCGSALHVSVCL